MNDPSALSQTELSMPSPRPNHRKYQRCRTTQSARRICVPCGFIDDRGFDMQTLKCRTHVTSCPVSIIPKSRPTSWRTQRGGSGSHDSIFQLSALKDRYQYCNPSVRLPHVRSLSLPRLRGQRRSQFLQPSRLIKVMGDAPTREMKAAETLIVF